MHNSILEPYFTKFQIQQHTSEWYEKRETLVTASKAAGLLECSSYGPYVTDNELKTLNILDYNNRINNDSAATTFGTQFESIARKSLEERLNSKIYELGLAVHDYHNWLGASPDGICILSKEAALQLGAFEIEDNIPCLIEIKCPFTRQINYKVPMDYWVQMQIQLEVWDLEYVLYSENEYSREEDGKLLKSWDTLVKRDKGWFQRVLPILQQNKHRLTKEKRYFWQNAVNPKQIRNWITNDPILDWLDRYSYLDSIGLEKDPIKKYDLAKFASKQTKLFHNEILKYFNSNTNINVVNIALNWYDKIKPTTNTDTNVEIQESTINKSYAKYAMTLKAIQDCTPIIADAILVNEKTNRWGKADLLVREDYLENLFNSNITNSNDTANAADIADTADTADNNPKKRKWIDNKEDNAKYARKEKAEKAQKEYKYYVVLTRFASLRLCADGVHMLNEPKQKLYKSYVGFLTDCLPINVKTSYGYIIGRKSSWTSKGLSYKRDGFSKSLGKISLNDKDSFVTSLIEDGINWITRLKEDGMNWSLKGEIEIEKDIDIEKDSKGKSAIRREKRKASTSLVSKPIELYPNMKNKNDYPWHNLKKRISKESEEITEILNIGPEKRNNMVVDGILKWSDIDEEDLHTYKISEKECVNNILSANKQNKIIGISTAKELLQLAEENVPEIECYVDFETVTDLNESIGAELFDTSPGIRNEDDNPDKQGQSNIIYMIGCLIRNNKLKKDEYFNYLIKTINPDNEKKVIVEWLNDLDAALSKVNNKTKIPIYHWSPAEVVQLKRVKKEYGLTIVCKKETISSFIDKMHFIDLYQIFKTAKVGIPGAFGYGLKTVAKALYNLGKIKDTWEENLNGADAMVAAWYLNDLNCNNIGRLDDKVIAKAFDPMQPTNLEDLAKEIILYNYYDCKVMEEIVEYVRFS